MSQQPLDPAHQRMIEHAEACGISRRNLLGSMGLAGLGMIAGSSIAAASPPPLRPLGTPLVKVPTSSGSSREYPVYESLDLPAAWKSRNSNAYSYYRYLKSLNLSRVDPKQVVESHARERGNVWNELPPQRWWKRMAYTLKVVDRIAREMNVSDVEIVSAYRSPAYNARCRGAKSHSWHMQNVAVDVKFSGHRPSRVTSTARELRNLGLFRGGVGGYWNFTHIDARGTNVDW